MPRLDALDWVITAMVGSASIAMQVADPLDEPRWNSEFSIDEGARDWFKAGPTGRQHANLTSHFLVGGAIAASSGVALFGRDDPADGMTLFMVHLQAMASTSFLTQVSKRSFGRTRPLYADGRRETRPDAHASFWSGHAALSFSAASSGCTLQVREALFDPWATPWLCGGLFGMAAGAGALRIVADKHYLSDVIVGAVMGTTVGYAITGLRAWDGPVQVAPAMLPSGSGLMLTGEF